MKWPGVNSPYMTSKTDTGNNMRSAAYDSSVRVQSILRLLNKA